MFEFSIFDPCDVTRVKFRTGVPLSTEICNNKKGLIIFEIIVGSIKFYISNIFGTRNPKIVFIFEIDDAFIN